MGDRFKKVQAGQPLKISAEVWNALLDLVRDAKNHKHDQRVESFDPMRQADLIAIRNSSGVSQSEFHVLGLDWPLISPTANLREFKNSVAMLGVVPQYPRHFGRFVILAEPLGYDKIGRAWISGVCPARVDVVDECHEWADIKSGDATTLISRPAGSARILWRAGGTGPQWAVIRLSNYPDDIQRFALLSPLSRCGSATAARITYLDGRWCTSDCPFTVYDSIGLSTLAPEGTFGWAKWMPDSGQWEVIQLGDGCCEPESSSSTSSSTSSESSAPSSESQSSESLSSESQSSESQSSESLSSESQSSESQPSESSWSGSDKSTAIIPASWASTGYTALFIHEMPEVRFDDVIIATVPQSDASQVQIDSRFVEACEPGSLEVCGIAPDKPISVGASVHGDRIWIRCAPPEPGESVRLVLRVTGIRRGFAGKRFPLRTREQFEANERFINSAYPADARAE